MKKDTTNQEMQHEDVLDEDETQPLVIPDGPQENDSDKDVDTGRASADTQDVQEPAVSDDEEADESQESRAQGAWKQMTQGKASATGTVSKMMSS